MKNKNSTGTKHICRVFYIFMMVSTLVVSFAGATTFVTNSESDFDEGVYDYVYYDNATSSLQMNSSFINGWYTSKVFDAGSNAVWNNLTWEQNLSTRITYYALDGSKGVYLSNDGISWSQQTSDYGGSSSAAALTVDSQNNVYILYDKAIYRSNNSGVNWSVINNSFTPYSQNGLEMIADNNNALFIIDSAERVFSSNDLGISWLEINDSFNSNSNSNVKGLGVNASNSYYALDGSKGVYLSNDGISWSQQTSDYGGFSSAAALTVDSQNNVYILYDKAIYRSNNSGVNWSVINNSFTPYSQNGLEMIADNNNALFIIDSAERVFSSNDSGISWLEINDSFNSNSNNNVKGFGSLFSKTNITAYMRFCNDACTNETWNGPHNNTVISLLNESSRYFQYKLNFTSGIFNLTPNLYGVTIDYDIINVEPTVSLNSPSNNSVFDVDYAVLNATVYDDFDNIDVWLYGDGNLLTSLTNQSNNSNIMYNWTDLSNDAHTWYLVVSDGIVNVTSVTYSFLVNMTENNTNEPSSDESSNNAGSPNQGGSGSDSGFGTPPHKDTSNAKNQEPASIPQPKKQSALFDVSIDLDSDKIISGDSNNELILKVSLVNFGEEGKASGTITYSLLDDQNNLVMEEVNELTVNRQSEFAKIFDLPKNIETGTYHIKVILEYGDNQKAFAENVFEIVPEEKSNGIFFFIKIALFAAVMLWILLIISSKINLKDKLSNTINRKDNNLKKIVNHGEDNTIMKHPYYIEEPPKRLTVRERLEKMQSSTPVKKLDSKPAFKHPMDINAMTAALDNRHKTLSVKKRLERLQQMSNKKINPPKNIKDLGL
ncbi:MAG: hypothetical protein Q8Q42_02280 [Nanoarchaeota archaeon]|nr:hypothetical protein [Nanoarchaeota archaeon]